ncbi:MAG TPA: S26 family signal peptidase [Gemmataceae bacterium]|nr:S26 family signal peptidase [Gemmataceae bacterium]
MREFIEMIATVAILVLLLKIFIAEAFIIPTGSMATTLLGAHKMVVCPQCGLEFSVNCSSEREPPYDPVIGCVCPNCRYQIDLRQERHPPSCASGDRLVVGKFLYDLHLNRVEREDIVVFKYPDTPQRHNEAINYIKRLVGKPGETIAVHQGDLYVYPDPDDPQAQPLTYPGRPRPDRPEELWARDYMYESDAEALELFRQGKFRRIQKSPNKILALRRLVYDNDHPAKDLAGSHFPPRWAPEEAVPTSVTFAGTPTDYRRGRQKAEEEHAWIPDGAQGFRHPARTGDLAWLRYRHLVVERSAETKLTGAASSESQPELITDFLGYDTWKAEGSFHGPPSPNWVGDLMLECTVNLESAPSPPSGDQFVLELSRGVDRFQARWDLSTGQCTLVRITAAKEEQLQSQLTSLKRGGNHFLRFANVDEKLVVWVDRSLPFGGGVTYASPAQSRPTANDLQPASIGVRGAAVRVAQLRLWRDTYYTIQPGRGDTPLGPENWSNPDRWQALGDLPVETFYVQPGHYLCMGDNSPESSDGRSWGLVPQRLLLGRALVVYYPFRRIGPIE